MKLSIKEQERIEYRFATFSKVVLRNTVCTYFKDLGRKRKHENSLEYLYEQMFFQAHSTDDYFVQYDISTDFIVHGQLITVDSEQLANALLCLSAVMIIWSQYFLITIELTLMVFLSIIAVY